jgi:hypothetical protein
MGGDAASQCQVAPPKKRGRPPTKQLFHSQPNTPGLPLFFLFDQKHIAHGTRAHTDRTWHTARTRTRHTLTWESMLSSRCR